MGHLAPPGDLTVTPRLASVPHHGQHRLDGAALADALRRPLRPRLRRA